MNSTALPKDFKAWLKRRAAPKSVRPKRLLRKRRGGVRKVSLKRAKQLEVYRVKRKAFLLAHPYCQIWLKRNGLTEEDRALWGGRFWHKESMTVLCAPRSEEIHHRAGRIGAKLLDEKDWLAASRPEHEWCHRSPREARALGLLV